MHVGGVGVHNCIIVDTLDMCDYVRIKSINHLVPCKCTSCSHFEKDPWSFTWATRFMHRSETTSRRHDKPRQAALHVKARLIIHYHRRHASHL